MTITVRSFRVAVFALDGDHLGVPSPPNRSMANERNSCYKLPIYDQKISKYINNGCIGTPAASCLIRGVNLYSGT